MSANTRFKNKNRSGNWQSAKTQRTVISRSKRLHRPRAERSWSALVPGDEWKIYRDTIRLLRSVNLEFMLGGGFCWANYTRHWRNTKDIDFFILPRDRQIAIDTLTSVGFEDYFDQRPYDRAWIYRAFKQGNIVDVIWSMANQRAFVDESWFARAPEISLRGERVRVLGAEELLWCKLYVLQRDHSDWPDLLNLLYAAGAELDWKHLLNRLGEDEGLLRGLLNVFAWVAPTRAGTLPGWLQRKLKLPQIRDCSRQSELRRVKLLDSRAWFAAAQPNNKPLAI
jgi:hypothetical protein